MKPVLIADDYALTDGVCRSIEALAFTGRISATSVMTTMPEWPPSAPRLREFRDRIAIGLHLNLTLGASSGDMPKLAPDRVLPSLPVLITKVILAQTSVAEIRQEVDRQLDAFERHLGYPPDHVDGHQHIQALPIVRQAVLDALAARYRGTRPLVRDPSEAAESLYNRAMTGAKADVVAGAKAAVVTGLSMGFARAAHRHGFVVNDGFAGFSRFDPALSYRFELEAELARIQGADIGIGIVMCHPGYPDAALAALDPVVGRRQQEHDALMALDGLPDRIWHPVRRADGPPVDWSTDARVAEPVRPAASGQTIWS